MRFEYDRFLYIPYQIIPSKQGLRPICIHPSSSIPTIKSYHQNKDEEMSGGHFESEAQRERRTERFHKPREERARSLCRGVKTSVVKQLTLLASKSSSHQNKD